MMHILISPNAFKNSLSAGEAAKAIAAGLQKSALSCTTTCLAVGDGGDGTGKLLTELSGGVFLTAETTDPLGRKLSTVFGLIDQGKTAVIEMAAASGLNLLQVHELDPMHASSYGTGELFTQALDKGVEKIILCVGGSATVDGGCGILAALGVRFLDRNGNLLTGMPESLVNLATVDMSALDTRIHDCEIIILCDVINTLLGSKGAAAVFGPQKGASAEQVQQLEAGLTQFNRVALAYTGIDMAGMIHGGAAGGTAAALCTFLQAKAVNGIEYFLDITGFDRALEKADLVITGEGSIDLQTPEGKAPYGVAMRAKKKNLPVIALAGKIPEQPHAVLETCFDVLLAIGHGPADVPEAMRSAYADLDRTAMQLGNLLAVTKS